MVTLPPTNLSEPDAVFQPREDHRRETAQGDVLRSVDPHIGETTKTYTKMRNDDVDAAIATARDRLGTRRRLPFAQRATLLCGAAQLCSERLEDLVRYMAIEMGGRDLSLVLEDAEPGSTVDWVVWGRVNTMGQFRVASKRVIVFQAIIEEIIEQFREQLAVLKRGDSLDELPDIAPINSEKAVKDLEDQINRSVAADAQIAIGGKRPIPEGVCIEPTILNRVNKRVPVH